MTSTRPSTGARRTPLAPRPSSSPTWSSSTAPRSSRMRSPYSTPTRRRTGTVRSSAGPTCPPAETSCTISGGTRAAARSPTPGTTPTGCSGVTCCCPGCDPPTSTSMTPTRTRVSRPWPRRSARPSWPPRPATPARTPCTAARTASSCPASAAATGPTARAASPCSTTTPSTCCGPGRPTAGTSTWPTTPGGTSMGTSSSPANGAALR